MGSAKSSLPSSDTALSARSNSVSTLRRRSSTITWRPIICPLRISRATADMVSDPADRAGAILEIDLAGIAANWRLLAQIVEPATCAAVVKADAYGLGAAQVSAALASAGCRLFFTATIEEGIALRHVLPEPFEIAVLNGALPGYAEE